MIFIMACLLLFFWLTGYFFIGIGLCIAFFVFHFVVKRDLRTIQTERLDGNNQKIIKALEDGLAAERKGK